MLSLAYGTFIQINAFLRTTPDYNSSRVREMAAGERAKAGLQPHELPKGQKLKENDYLLEYQAYSMTRHFGPGASSNTCLLGEIQDFRHEIEHFEKTARRLKWTHKPEFIEAQRESMREWAKTIITRGRLSFENMPEAVKASLLQSGYVPPKAPVADSCLGTERRKSVVEQ
jgi:hypothetical protein